MHCPVSRAADRAESQTGYRADINEQLIELFIACDSLTQAKIAKKIGRRPEQVSRWLASPSNLEADTTSDLALAMGCRPKFNLVKVGIDDQSQQDHPFNIAVRTSTPGPLVNIPAIAATSPGVNIDKVSASHGKEVSFAY